MMKKRIRNRGSRKVGRNYRYYSRFHPLQQQTQYVVRTLRLLLFRDPLQRFLDAASHGAQTVVKKNVVSEESLMEHGLNVATAICSWDSTCRLEVHWILALIGLCATLGYRQDWQLVVLAQLMLQAVFFRILAFGTSPVPSECGGSLA